jgi:aminoglycoside phosphotransferase family enzyme
MRLDAGLDQVETSDDDALGPWSNWHGMAVTQRAFDEIQGQPTLAEKVAWLKKGSARGLTCDGVDVRETHMSWVFLVGAYALKLKKPVRFAYLDFSTIERRETYCREELRLNRRLAPDVYLDVVPLTIDAGALHIGGSGTIVDWLVVMRRLDERVTLERAILSRQVDVMQLDRLTTVLSAFYRHARRIIISDAVVLADLRKDLALDCRILLEPRLGLPSRVIRRVMSVERLYLEHFTDQLRGRIQRRRIIDGHGDLRPEHIWLDDEVRIIDCLEFNPRLRAVDPIDELAFLTLECERLGAAWVGQYVYAGIMRRLREDAPPELYYFYRCRRALLRARLAIAHLLEPNPRTPEKWPRTARAYLSIAARDADALERLIRRRRGPSGRGPDAGARWSRPAAALRTASQPCPAAVRPAAGTVAPYR